MFGFPRRPKPASSSGEAAPGVAPAGPELESELRVPVHIAMIMDGNGRWAKAQGLPRLEGHRQGALTVRMVVEECRRLGVRYLTLYCFSSENWQRPAEEVSGLMRLLTQYLESELSLLLKHGVRLRAIGDMNRLSGPVREALQRVLDGTKDQNGMDLILAVSYGSRDELVHAVRSISEEVARGGLLPQTIDARVVQRHLYAPDVPDPDLLIRTSGEFRISNFLLWQLAYSEIVVSPLFWPEFSKEELLQCLREYSRRNRRYGLTAEQLSAASSGNPAGSR